LAEFMEKLHELADLLGKPGEWLKYVVVTGVEMQRAGMPEAEVIAGLLSRWHDLANRGSQFLKQRVDVAKATYDKTQVDLPLENLAAGKRPFGLLGLGRSEAKQRIETVTIGGRPPATEAEWRLVRDCRHWHRDIDKFLVDWD